MAKDILREYEVTITEKNSSDKLIAKAKYADIEDLYVFYPSINETIDPSNITVEHTASMAIVYSNILKAILKSLGADRGMKKYKVTLTDEKVIYIFGEDLCDAIGRRPVNAKKVEEVEDIIDDEEFRNSLNE